MLVTDDNGRIDTSSAWIAHGRKTNANDAALGADGTVDESLLDPGAGVWFGKRHDGSMTDTNEGLARFPTTRTR